MRLMVSGKLINPSAMDRAFKDWHMQIIYTSINIVAIFTRYKIKVNTCISAHNYLYTIYIPTA